jgi:hypothetical protein
MTWGKTKENGLWISRVSDWRLMFRGHDSLYVAAGRLRLRIMKLSSTMLQNTTGEK